MRLSLIGNVNDIESSRQEWRCLDSLLLHSLNINIYKSEQMGLGDLHNVSLISAVIYYLYVYPCLSLANPI